ncbi:MAG TPA: hypothetical protein VGP24_04495 [Glaciihabitans sp.]|nr:hypothetical protein [Glaciihabitans sp.]
MNPRVRATEYATTLGTGYLAGGAVVLCTVQAMYGLILFASRWDSYPSPMLGVAAWVIYIATLTGSVVFLSAQGDRAPSWSYGVFLLLLAGVVVLDLGAIWSLGNVGEYATASVSAGFSLLLQLTLRSARQLLAPAVILGVVLLCAIVATTPLTAETVPAQLTTLTFAVLPIAAGVFVLRGFRRVVQHELDRVLVQSTISAPRFAVGMLASEELARLDLAAEELLDSVSTGRESLPLSPATASVAASLATELRLHLIEGRRETWLYHAVTESALLGKSVTLTDRDSLAGLLDVTQRDGLLSAVWLLVSDTGRLATTHTVQLVIGPAASATTERRSGNKMTVPIVITTTGIPRNRVDPATWESIRQVGRYSDSTENSSVRLDIAALVDNPADHAFPVS